MKSVPAQCSIEGRLLQVHVEKLVGAVGRYGLREQPDEQQEREQYQRNRTEHGRPDEPNQAVERLPARRRQRLYRATLPLRRQCSTFLTPDLSIRHSRESGNPPATLPRYSYLILGSTSPYIMSTTRLMTTYATANSSTRLWMTVQSRACTAYIRL